MASITGEVVGKYLEMIFIDEFARFWRLVCAAAENTRLKKQKLNSVETFHLLLQVPTYLHTHTHARTYTGLMNSNSHARQLKRANCSTGDLQLGALYLVGN